MVGHEDTLGGDRRPSHMTLAVLRFRCESCSRLLTPDAPKGEGVETGAGTVVVDESSVMK